MVAIRPRTEHCVVDMSTPSTSSESPAAPEVGPSFLKTLSSWMSAHIYLIAGVGLMIGFAFAMSPTAPSQPSDAPAPTAAGMVEVAPGGVVAPEDVPEAVSVFYRGAHEHPDVFKVVPCFCGCEEMLDHKNLLDCFARSDGSGWEAHALGCGVCLAEANQILEMLDQGVSDPTVIREAVIARFSDPYKGVSS